jgi:VWFA-related protein
MPTAERVVLVCALCMAGGLAAAPAAWQDQPTFRAGTTLVEVSAIVTRDGRPLEDLTPEDIQVLDNGVVQPLVAFEFVDLTVVTGPAQRRDFVLVIDDLHIEPRLTRPTQNVALALVRALGPHDRLAIVNTGPHECVLQLSTDRAEAERLLRDVRGQRPLGPPVQLQDELNARIALQVIGDVVTEMQGDASERRAIVLVSEGHSVLPEGTRRDDNNVGVRDAYMALLRDAALANVAVYAIDPRGLVAGFASTGNILGAMTAESVAGSLAGRRFGSLGRLASHTGGLLTVDSNHLHKDIPRILQDSRQYYRLVYVQPEPEPGKAHPETRRIDVKVSRPGVQVRARQQYVPRAP